MPEIFYEYAGLAGVAVYIGAYAALQSGLLRGTGYLYASLNILAAGLVLVSLFNSFNLSSALIQVSWIVISLFGMARFFLLTRRLSFSDEERQLLETHFHDMPRLTARRFLDAGDWSDVPAGSVLAKADKILAKLIYVHTGGADVYRDGRKLAAIGPGEFVGEMTVLSHQPATADVVASENTRVFEISSEALEQSIRRDPQAQLSLEAALRRDGTGKLLSMRDGK